MFARSLLRDSLPRTVLKVARGQQPMRCMASKTSSMAKYDWTDPLNLNSLLTEEETIVK